MFCEWSAGYVQSRVPVSQSTLRREEPCGGFSHSINVGMKNLDMAKKRAWKFGLFVCLWEAEL